MAKTASSATNRNVIVNFMSSDYSWNLDGAGATAMCENRSVVCWLVVSGEYWYVVGMQISGLRESGSLWLQPAKM